VTRLKKDFAIESNGAVPGTVARTKAESLGVITIHLRQNLRWLANLVYPTVPIAVRDTPAKKQYIEALKENDMLLHIKEALPVDFNDAIRHPVELDAFSSAEGRLAESKGYLLIDYLLFYVPLKNFSLLWRRRHYR
jgi:hypothetical protein